MSSITFSTGFAPSRPAALRGVSAARPALRLTRRGRVLLVLFFTVLVMAAMALRGGFAVASLEAGTPEPVRVIQVQPGDTLYAIAGALAAPGEVREMVQRIQDLNSLPDGAALEVGSQLAVPKN